MEIVFLILQYFQFEVRQAGQITIKRIYARMDNIKIHDTRFQNLNHKSLLGYLTLQSNKSTNGLKKRTQSIQTSISTSINSDHHSKYLFKILHHQIGQHVEYIVQVQQCFKVLGRRIKNKIKFRTRYSLLQKLNEKLNKKSFPPKKYFGNKSIRFIEERKKQLELFLNEISSERSGEFLKFIKQIKDADFNKELNRQFRLD